MFYLSHPILVLHYQAGMRSEEPPRIIEQIPPLGSRAWHGQRPEKRSPLVSNLTTQAWRVNSNLATQAWRVNSQQSMSYVRGTLFRVDGHRFGHKCPCGLDMHFLFSGERMTLTFYFLLSTSSGLEKLILVPIIALRKAIYKRASDIEPETAPRQLRGKLW
ncbi:MAG: hypothetical protein ACPGWR_12615 [Ardenticatenaceae bacterium]